MKRQLAPIATLTGLMLASATAPLLSPAPVWANMASPNRPGDAIGEPSGELRDIAIEHERLGFDLRPLAQGQPAGVTATYEIRNDGAGRTIELIFIAPSLNGGPGTGRQPSVTLDGSQVEYRVSAEQSNVWPPPSTTPGLNGRPIAYYALSGGQLVFSLAISPGPHSIAVTYRANPTLYSGDSPTVYWQLGYVLAPARRWASFGTLDVAVKLPPGWRAASEPQLARTGDELTGTFEGLPGDTLGLTAQMPPPGGGLPWPLIGVAVTMIAAALVGWLLGRMLGARNRSSLWVLPLAIAYGIGSFVVVIILGMVADGSRTAGVPAAQVAWTYGYGSGLLFVLLSPVVAVFAGSVLQVAAWHGSVRARNVRRQIMRGSLPPA